MDCSYKKEFCESIRGNALDIKLKKDDCEIRANLTVGKKKCVRIWGQVKDCNGKPIENALVKLLKPVYYHGKKEYVGLAHTNTDCMGFYQFDVCPKDDDQFRVIVSKAVSGKERIIHGNGICDVCEEEDKCDCDYDNYNCDYDKYGCDYDKYDCDC